MSIDPVQDSLLNTPSRGIRRTPTLRRAITPRRRLLLLSIFAAALVSTGCDRNIEAYQPGEEPSAPDLARIFPAPPGGVGSAEAAAATDTSGRNSGPPNRQALPPSRAEAAPAAASAPATAPATAAPIEGEIRIAPEWAGKSPAGAILFVIARSAGASGGPPLAVLRIADPKFPLAFSIGPENVMIPSMQFAGSISLSARLDADGNAMTRGAGDVSSPVLAPMTPGTTGVEIVLSEGS